ncbi:kinetochore complex Sim4 subunit Fta1-domain-containing protein [Annulohypoxylon truncatum]|uniref:kinetochore complex Sim4 subunit Fta1-domain-containing protein n=1 Tax=Annulohypoxylon truncatum TaxID=327061 RepID=UPI002007299A|nr:kinetochore complex Sim4 subunit Fta1-domain-containing protein [Annulohypoxylon truncatum]KAI1206030.1 kinetochore complex Sim4 subunit Fta1-domain-containing protein [Annulohypoxylon truncatum]
MPPRKRKPNPPASPSPPPPPPARSPSPDRSATASASASPSANSSYHSSSAAAADADPPRFFNTTFTTYRASPLYLGSQGLPPSRLDLLSRRLRDALVGDVVRGVQVGLGPEGDGGAALGRTGALYGVEWRWVDAERILGDRGRGREGSVELGNGDGDGDEGGEGGRRRSGTRVMCIELRYENARFSALLLPDLGGEDGSAGSRDQLSWTWKMDEEGTTGSRASEAEKGAFLHLPLLLFRMPAPLKSVLVDFLSSTFDCRISPLALGTRSLISSWEAWLSDNGSNNGRKALSKDVLITLGFHIEPPEPKPKALGSGGSGEGEGNGGDQVQKSEQRQLGLKSIDITIPAADVHRFLRAGERLDESQGANARKRKADAATILSDEQQSRRRRKLAGGRDEEGWAWRTRNGGSGDDDKGVQTEIIEQPFTEALAEYVWHHLGLDMFHPGVRIQRVACDGFALSDGRLKVFAPGRHRDGDEEESAVWKLMRGLAQRAKGRSGWSSAVMKGLVVP